MSLDSRERALRFELCESRQYLCADLFAAQTVVDNSLGGPRMVISADIDGDLDLDLVVSAAKGPDEAVVWYPNLDGLGSFGQAKRITNDPLTGLVVHTSDIDGDGDVDVVAGNFLGGDSGRIAWYENDGRGNFAEAKIVEKGAGRGANSIHGGDFDGDGDYDLIAALDYSNLGGGGVSTITWFENTDGQGEFRRHVISDAAFAIRSVVATDVDSDGDLDIVSNIAWYENADGGFTPRALQTGFAWHVFPSDLDGDSDVDVLFANLFEDSIGWSENVSGRGDFGRPTPISDMTQDAFSVFAGDFDRDGDADVLSASAADNKIACYRNTGQAIFDSQQVLTGNTRRPQFVFAADLDGDQDLDALTVSLNDNRVSWFENLSLSPRSAGDSNGDGKFDSADLILVFQAGEFEDDIANNSTFEEGDWNGDGDFTTSDLVLAFQQGNYVAETVSLFNSPRTDLILRQLGANDLRLLDQDEQS